MKTKFDNVRERKGEKYETCYFESCSHTCCHACVSFFMLYVQVWTMVDAIYFFGGIFGGFPLNCNNKNMPF